MFSPLLIGLLLALIVAHTLWQSLSSPLNRIPGPWYAKFTTLVLKWHEFRANRTRYIHRLHLEYGPAVRIAPDEVAFASAGAVKEIYCSGGSGYDKTDFYDLFKVYGRRTMFTTLDKDAVRPSPEVTSFAPQSNPALACQEETHPRRPLRQHQHCSVAVA